MTSSEPTIKQVAIFIADWYTCNDSENIDHKAGPEAGADRLREAVEAAFPKVSEATVVAALREVMAVVNSTSVKIEATLLSAVSSDAA